ncbi:MAG: thymidine kinase [Desulfosarcinaceae bacterium]|nr:thymidine kinase [Desulfosarcinaceae bacterium]
MAKLYFRYGAMNCGKSTALIQVDYNYRERGMATLIVKPHTDTKGQDQIVSRLSVSRQVDILAGPQDDLFTQIRHRKSAAPLDCVLVDEAQFLTATQVDQLFLLAVRADIPVICYGLRTDFKMDGFEGSQRLLLLAHSIEELKTICKCGRKAMVNGRKLEGRFVFEGDQVAIDGEGNIEYESLCPHCYFKYKAEAALTSTEPLGTN